MNVGSAGPITHLTCIKADTGQRAWQKTRFGKGNFIAADGKLFLTTVKGELVIARATPKRDYYFQSARGNRLFELGLGEITLAFAGVSLLLAQTIGPRRRTRVKLMPYESGMDPIGDARQHFDVKFYLIAILFLVFDVELIKIGEGR